YFSGSDPRRHTHDPGATPVRRPPFFRWFGPLAGRSPGSLRVPELEPLEERALLDAAALADFTGQTDGAGRPFPDLVVANTAAGTINIYLGRLEGQFAAAPTVTLGLPGGAAPSALVVTDFSGDGKPDIAVANSGLTSAGANSVSVFLNNSTTPGALSFGARSDFNGGNNPVGIVAANFDGDPGRNLDLALANGTVNGANNFTVTVLLGNGTGGFGAPTATKVGDVLPNAAELTSPTGLSVGPLNGDGSPDLAVSGSNGLVVLLNTTAAPGLPTFSALPARLTNTPTTSVAVGNLDFDTTPDVVATTASGGGQALVFQN